MLLKSFGVFKKIVRAPYSDRTITLRATYDCCREKYLNNHTVTIGNVCTTTISYSKSYEVSDFTKILKTYDIGDIVRRPQQM